MNTDKLIDAVIAQMKTDIEANDWTAIAELLAQAPQDALKAFLPEFAGMYESNQGETA